MTREARVVDARGLLCPWPTVRLNRAAREMQGRGQVRVIGDDPVASEEIAALCVERGWTIAAHPHEKSTFDILFG